MAPDFTFVHAADIHLDSALSGLAARDETFSAAMRGATRRAFANLVDLAIREQAAFVLIAGDLYDGTWKDQSTGQFAVAQLTRLARAGIRAFLIFGNHDAESRVSRHLTLPDLVYRFDHRSCDTVRLDDLGVAVHGRSYRTAATTEDLAASYCPPVPGAFNIAMLHTALDGHAGHAPYAPCSLDQLRHAGHDYWALGHVHERAVRSTFPHVVFPGNVQGRHMRETGAKGVTLVRVSAGSVVAVEHHACDEVRFARADVDAAGAADEREVLSGIGTAIREAVDGIADRPTAVRVRLRAGDALYRRLVADTDWLTAEVRAQAAIARDDIWIESLRFESAGSASAAALLPDMAEFLTAAGEDLDCARALMDAVAPLIAKLPADCIDADLAPLFVAARAGDAQALLAVALSQVAARLGGRAP